MLSSTVQTAKRCINMQVNPHHRLATEVTVDYIPLDQTVTILQKLKNTLYRRRENVAILGIDYPEYKFAEQLESSGKYSVLFFIDDNPWNFRNRIGNAVIRSLSDLPPLCEKHDIKRVFYFDDIWLKRSENYNLPLITAEEFEL